MNNRVIQVTRSPISVLGPATVRQEIYLATDVSDCDQLDLEVTLHQLSSGNFTARVVTGMDISDEGGWYTPTGGTFTSLSLPDSTASVKLAAGLLRFIRWEVVLDASATCTFFIQGMGRSYVG